MDFGDGILDFEIFDFGIFGFWILDFGGVSLDIGEFLFGDM